MEKICIKCQEKKELNKFDKLRKSKVGYRNQCRTCLYEKGKDRILNLTNEVGTREDLVATLQNNMILVEDLATA